MTFKTKAGWCHEVLWMKFLTTICSRHVVLYNLKAVRLMMVVMPYPSNPCEDSWTKRGKTISCHFNFNFLSKILTNAFYQIGKVNLAIKISKFGNFDKLVLQFGEIQIDDGGDALSK